MKSNLDQLMEQRGIDAAVILGPDGFGTVNAPYNYFVGGRHITGVIFKKRGQKAQLIHNTMERDSAAQTGLDLLNFAKWPLKEIQEQFPKPFDAKVELWRRMFIDLGITGKVGIYGTCEASATLALIRELEQKVPGLTVVAEGERDIIELARETKDVAEIELMRQVGVATCDVVEQTKRFLQSHKVQNETLIRADGKPLTIGDAKAFIARAVLDKGMEQEDCIFAIGRDAGVPHNHGTPTEPIRLGRPIIFDIFPRRIGGYFHDMTRTWCLGYAPPEVQKAYDDVKACFEKMVTLFKPGVRTHEYQMAACEFFENRGHKTIRQDAALDHGYIHGLGHGLGLQVHEQPGMPTFANPPTTLEPGIVFTVEPGLYYPERGFGARIEDTYYCDSAAKFHSLTPYSMDLVVKMG